MSIEDDIRKLLNKSALKESTEVDTIDSLVESLITEELAARDVLFQKIKSTTLSKKEPGALRKFMSKFKAVVSGKKVNEELVSLVESVVEELEEEQIIDEILALDEISKKTLGSYIKKSAMDHGTARREMGDDFSKKDGLIRAKKRMKGIVRATDRLTREQKETIGDIIE